MTTIERKEIGLQAIAPHPHNREFPSTGEDWCDFVEDIAEKGILVELVVRAVGAGYECLQGHRRRAAALEAGLEAAPCKVVTATDEEAYDVLWEGNLHRLNPDPVDEARYVRGAMEIFHKTEAEIARRMRRSIEWVRTRQGLLDLGDEVLEAVRREDPRERLSMGAVEEILRVPEEYRADAVQLVLLPHLEWGPLTAEQAKFEIRVQILEPRAREAQWEKLREKLQKTWRKELARKCQPGTAEELAVVARPLAEAERLRTVRMQPAEAAVPLAEVLPGAPVGLLWLHVAVKHGLAVQIVPGQGKELEETEALVDAYMLRDAEAAAAEHGGEAWLVTGKRTAVEERVARAKAVAEGEGDPLYQDDGEEAETVIEQRMEHAAMIDMGAVKRVALWAVSSDADPMNAPEYVPQWACRLGVEGMWDELDAACRWVMELKK